MKYANVCTGIFISRPNRFIAKIYLAGCIEIAHVKNTGRCKELLVKGAQVVLKTAPDNNHRVTKYDLIAVWKGERLVNMDSQAPNQVFGEYLLAGNYIPNLTLIKPEKKYSDSRFDFYVETKERKIFIEVKGVTLEQKGVVLFPDAPTLRGVKHIQTLMQCIGDGYEAHIVFVVQMSNVQYFTPNYETHPAFGETLTKAQAYGVQIAAFECTVSPDSLLIDKAVECRLGMG